MPEEEERLDSLLSHAREQESCFDWAAASESYGEALSLACARVLEKERELLEQRAYTLSRLAFQAESNDEFRKRIAKSLEALGSATEAYRKASDPKSAAMAARCEAVSSYLRFWMEKDVAKKKELVNRAWKATRDALASFSSLEEHFDLALTYNRLHMNAILAWNYEESPDRRSNLLGELVRFGDEVAEELAEGEPNKGELARALVNLASALEASSTSIPMTVENSKGLITRAGLCLQRAAKLDEQAMTCEEIYACLILGLDYSLGEAEEEPSVARWLEMSVRTGDRLLQGIANSWAACRTDWRAASLEVPEDAEKLLSVALNHVNETRRHFACIGFVAPDFVWLPWPSAPGDPWYYWRLERLEMDHAKKRELAVKMLSDARIQLEVAQESGYPAAMASAPYVLAIALDTVADTETDEAKRKAMREEALGLWKRSVEGTDMYEPGHLWDRGIARCLYAGLEQKLAQMTMDREARVAYAESSADHMRDGMTLMVDSYVRLTGYESVDPTFHAGMGLQWGTYGRILRTKSEILCDRSILKAAADAYDKAAEEAMKAEREGRTAEYFWEGAKVYDALDEFVRSSERFDRASEHYGKAAKKVDALHDYYEGYAVYMKAWAEIEKAKYHHSKQEPSKAKEHYKKAADLHSASRPWKYLALNYQALSEIENAEDFSRREDFESSRRSFNEAARLFANSKESLRAHLDKIGSADEIAMASALIGATDMRIEFCRARDALEEARLLDRRGQENDASEKYGQAAEMLQTILTGSTSDQSRKEIGLILALANAWKAMSLAEAEASPQLYEDAARLFEEAKDLSPGERAKNLTLGHSRFCKALEAGARFADTGDLSFHGVATDNLESAARYYVKAGFDSAAEYARASKLLFDAYAQMGMAGKEPDHDKKARTYALIEKLLEASASSFDKAGQSGRKDQVLKLLKRAKDERQLAVSLTQVFHAPEAVAATVAFTSPAPTHEMAAGLDKFEHADVQATLIARPKDLYVGQDILLDIELVNAGKGTAQLTKVDRVIPEGFAIVSEPQKCRVEEDCLNMRGKRLGALRTEDVRLVLRPTAHGSFTLNPRIMYLDGSGRYKSCEPEPVVVAVRQLGISGWLKGSGTNG